MLLLIGWPDRRISVEYFTKFGVKLEKDNSSSNSSIPTIDAVNLGYRVVRLRLTCIKIPGSRLSTVQFPIDLRSLGFVQWLSYSCQACIFQGFTSYWERWWVLSTNYFFLLVESFSVSEEIIVMLVDSLSCGTCWG